MAKMTVNGSTIGYELIGDGPPVILMPRGSFGEDVEGLRPLADELSRSTTLVMWDRPNAGVSDLKFGKESGAQMAADDLVGLRDGGFRTKQCVAVDQGALFDNWHLLATAICDLALA
jgi:hypothetical protein